MGTLSSELAPHAERLTARPRIYADANVPAGLIAYMRDHLQWDVLFVLEDEKLRRASDIAHFRLAHQLRRTLVTMDRDYLDDRRFPPDETSGVLVVQAPDERQLAVLLQRIDRVLFPPDESALLPVERRKLHLHGDWTGDEAGQGNDAGRNTSTGNSV
jgi:uncharacterized protein DUF5615